MMFTTFYFSGTGNTKWAVDTFAQKIRKQGHTVKSYAIEELLTDTLLQDVWERSDYVGFAQPIYGANIPPIMQKFVRRMLDRAPVKKPIFCINTVGYVNAFGPLAAARLLSGLGPLVGYVNLRICNNASTPRFRTSPASRDVLNKRLAKGRKALDRLTDKLIAKEKYISGMGPYLLPGFAIRAVARRGIGRHYTTLGVNSETCDDCGLCERICPTGSISKTGHDFVFASSCTACMRCYNLCPTGSITISGQYADPNVYERHHGPDQP